MDARNNIATDLFYKIRSRFTGLKLGAETGEITINPEEARFFDFDYMEGENPIGHVSISLAEPNSMKIYFSHGITETMDTAQKGNWYKFLRELRQFAKRRLLAFDTRDIAKDNLDKRDYAFLSQNANKPQEQTPNTIQKPVGESVMNESAMYGSRTMSYQKLMDTRLIIKHSQAVMDDTQPGARTRHISALFVENQDGERFKYPFIHLAGARAMQRHVANGGLPYDDIGKSIVRMSEEIAQLKSFGNYVVRNDLMNSENNGIVERSSSYLNQLRETVAKLAKQSHYEAYRESFQAQDSLEVPEEVVEDFVEKFTVRNFKEDIKSVFPVLYRLMQEDNSIGYNDIVAMTQTEEQTNEDIEVDETEEQFDPFDKFESWVMGVGESSTITSQDPDEQAQAVRELQELVGQHFPAGVDGINAIESLKGIIEDPALFQEIKAASKEDADTCVRPLVKAWLEQNAPEVLDQLDFGDMVEQESIEEADAPRRTKPRYKYQSGPSAKDFGHPGWDDNSPDAEEKRKAWYQTDKAKEFSTASSAHHKAQKAAQYKHAGVDPKQFDIVTEIPNPYFDPNGPEDEDDPNFEYEEIEVGINYDAHISGQYRPATWGYHGGDPEEFAELEIDDFTVIDLGSGEDITKVVDHDTIIKIIEKEADYDPYYTPGKRRYSDYDESADIEQQEPRKLDVKELAEFITSFYDRESGTFPKGPEGVCTMVGKKFGEQAEQVARKFVERMAPQQQISEAPWEEDGIQVGGRVVSVQYPDMKGEVVMIDPKLAQRVYVQWDQGGRAEPVQRSRLKAISKEDIELESIKRLSGISKGLGF